VLVEAAGQTAPVLHAVEEPLDDDDEMPPAASARPDEPTPRSGVARVEQVLLAAGLTDRVRHLDASARTAVEAAEALGCPVGAIASSLLFQADGAPLLVVASGAHRVDTDRVAHLLGVGAVTRAPARLVRQATGFVIGGVAPVGHPSPIRTLLDVALRSYDTVWASAGHPHAVFSTTCDELRTLTGAPWAEVGHL
jgi:prolyl-tRNA editing enzyme YbaK/EbsC (Cys-tRNA(Pro) deacylase)